MEREVAVKPANQKPYHNKKRELTPEEKQLLADKKAAKVIAAACCSNCANKSTQTGHDEDGLCSECYSLYDPKIKRFWLARYKRIKD